MSSLKFADNEPLTEEEIRQAAVSGFKSIWAESDLEENWEDAYGYYKGELPAATSATDSTAVSTDVSDIVEWLLPAILKPLVESPDVVRFDPVNPEDQAQADLESDYVHHTFMKRCGGFVKLYNHIKDALLLKNAVFCTYWDEGVTSQKEEYRDLTEVELADLLSPADDTEVRLVSSKKRTVPVPDPMTGAPLQPTPEAPEVPTVDLYDVVVRRFASHGRPVVENCRPEMFKIDMGHGSIDLDDARWCSYTVLKTRAQLLALGYSEDLIDRIPKSQSSLQDQTRAAREDVENSANAFGQENETGDPSQDFFDVHRVYMTLDADGDGFEEKYLILLGGGDGEVLLDYYEVPENPFSASTPFIAAHKFYGYSVFDKVRSIADRKSKVLRMLEDNLDLANNPRKKVVRGAANLDDVLLATVGGIWRVDDPNAVMEIPTTPINQQAAQLLDYYDKQRSERTGVDPNAQAITNVMPDESMNHAMERVLSMKEELVGMLIRVFAETGVKSMFVKLRNLMLRNMPREELVQLRNKWTRINPGNWVERTNTTVVVGLGTGDRIKKQNALMQVLGIQQQIAQGGMMGILVSPERLAYTVSELIRVTGLGDPDDYILDPSLLETEDFSRISPRGRETLRAIQMEQGRQQQAMQMEQAKTQAAQQQQNALLQVQKEIEGIRAQAKLAEAQIQSQDQTRALMAQIQQFQEENRRKWAELAAKVDTEHAKAAANVATTLVQHGVNAMEAENDRQHEKDMNDAREDSTSDA